MRIGFIGIGRQAKFHAEAAAALGCEISAAMASSIHSRSWAEWQFPSRRCQTVNEVAEHCDKLVVAGPWHLNAFLSRFALSQSRPCLLEKPVALQAEDVPRETSNAMVGFNRRFYEPVQRLKERGTDDLISVHCVISEWIHHHIAQTGRDVIPHLLEFTSCHTLNLLLYLLGDLYPETIGGQVDALHVNGMCMTYDDVPVHLTINQNDPSPVGLWFRFKDETWVLSPLETLSIYRGIEIKDDGQHRSYEPRLIERIECDRTYKPGILAQMRAFLDDDHSVAATLDDQRKVLNFIQKIKPC